MLKRGMVLMIMAVLLAAAGTLVPTAARAHQPYCEFEDVTADSPWQAPDSSISYAYYGNLYPAQDVDYFTFEAEAGQSVLLSLSIPAIDGQEDFAPVMALFGPGVKGETALDLPARISVPEHDGGMMVDLGEEPEYWYEPFGGRYYWNFENSYFEAPQDATYMVALWHPEQELGRYSFVVGEREVFGGDRDCMASFNDYWTPLLAGEDPYRTPVAVDTMMDESMGDAMGSEMAADMTGMDDGKMDSAMDMGAHMHADGAMHDHGAPLEMASDTAPVVDLQLIPLSDGSYNVRIQTMNFTFAPQNVDGEPADGEGHAHLYVDDEKVARIYGEWYHLDSLPEDAQQVYVSLYANNHQPLVVDGEPIADVVMVGDLMALAE